MAAVKKRGKKEEILINQPRLSLEDKELISSKSMLNDNIMMVIMNLLKDAYPELGGFQDTVLSISKKIYKLVDKLLSTTASTVFQ